MSSSSTIPTIIGRFAPSPTGPLHWGSLLAALGSYLQARQQGGKWLLRIEDLDPPREIAGAADDIQRTLEYFHLYWDDRVVYQSQRLDHYRAALEDLNKKHLIYPCSCSRKTIQPLAHPGPLGMVYPGTCRNKRVSLSARHSLRLRVADKNIAFMDKRFGPVSLNLAKEIGDVNLFRADGYFAYHLAVVVDDYLQGVSEIVRGSDLILHSPLHIYLQQCLGYPVPDYLHLPILVNEQGEKLSKQTGAQAIARERPEQTLLQLLTLLGQNPSEELQDANTDEILQWAVTHWNIPNIPITPQQIIDNQH